MNMHFNNFTVKFFFQKVSENDVYIYIFSKSKVEETEWSANHIMGILLSCQEIYGRQPMTTLTTKLI